MSTNKLNQILSRIDDLVVEDILETSDEEIIAQLNDEEGNAANAIAHTKEVAKKAILMSRKSRLKQAQEAVKQSCNVEQNTNVFALPIEKKKEFIENAKRNNNELTLAARNEEDMSENDTDTILQDLIELGIIDENGNLK